MLRVFDGVAEDVIPGLGQGALPWLVGEGVGNDLA
jgi:hypothetical protein